MRIDANEPIATFAAELPGAMAIFESFDLDYACAGNLSLDDAAHAAGIAPDVVITSLRRLEPAGREESWNDRPLADLIHHLVAQHHRFVREELARIALRLADLCTAPGPIPADLLLLRSVFAKLSEIVLPHLHHEEEKAFRAIEAVEKAWQSNESLAAAGAGLDAALTVLAEEHRAIAVQVRAMRELRLRLIDSEDRPPQCVSLLDDIARLEAHLHEYTFLENWILFPRAAALVEQTPDEVSVG